MKSILPLTTFAYLLYQCHAIARFQMNGPVLTVTLKDPIDTDNNSADGSSKSEEGTKWLNFNNLKPNLSWTIDSQTKPLPNWLPSLQSLRLTANYNHLYSQKQVEGLATFNAPGNVKVQVQPSITSSTNKQLKLQLQKGSMQFFCKLANRGVALVRASYQTDQFPGGTLGGIRITPQLDLTKSEPSCLLEATTSSQRTKTVLNLEYQNPTLSIVHALDERHVIAPEISLYNAKITYQWDVKLDSGSIRTKVDPTQAVHVTWTDLANTGRWVTDVRLPLAGTTLRHLAADVRVRRQFRF